MMPAQSHNDLHRARELLLSGDSARALPIYERLVRQSPGAAVIWYEYGNAASKCRRMELADRAWTKAVETDPQNAELVGMVGHQYEGLRRPERAAACFRQAAAADPRGINPRVSLAVLLEKSHRLAEARAAVNECLAIDPRDD